MAYFDSENTYSGVYSMDLFGELWGIHGARLNKIQR
jgi:hypothetical protein